MNVSRQVVMQVRTFCWQVSLQILMDLLPEAGKLPLVEMTTNSNLLGGSFQPTLRYPGNQY